MIHFSITHTIIAKIERIRSIWGVIENASIVPEWEQKLKKIARLRSAVFSTKIEGSQILLNDAERFFDGKEIIARSRDKQELSNYMKVLDYIEKRETGKKLEEKDIFVIHALTTDKILPKELQNTYRNQQNVIYSATGGIVYMPPEAIDVPNLMKELIQFMNEKTEISPLIRAGLLHHWFVIIHPFMDGNGRTARALTQLFLYQNGFNTKKYFSLEEYYDSDLDNYYKSIATGPNYYTNLEKEIDSTSFLEYFLSGIEYELTSIKNQIESLKGDEYFETNLRSLHLSNRQLHFMLSLREKGRMKSSDFEEKFGLSIATIKRELKELIEKGCIIASGKGKSTHYELNMSRKGAE